MRAEKLRTALVEGWRCLWFRPFDPLPAAVFRVCLGLLLTAMYLAIAPSWAYYFGADGVLSLTDQTLPAVSNDWWSVFYWLPRVPFRIFWVVGLLAAMAFAVGWKTRLCTIVLFVLEMSMVHRNRFAINGEDLVARMMLFYACFAPLGRALSLDSWIEARSRARGVPIKEEFPPIWPIRLMQINVALIYAISLPYKLNDDIAWLNGEAIYLSITSNLWGRFPWPALFYGPLSDTFTYFTILAEGSFPLLVWFRHTRLYVVVAIASLHLGIAFMLKSVAFFSLAMVCCFWIFVPAPAIRTGWLKMSALAERILVDHTARWRRRASPHG